MSQCPSKSCTDAALAPTRPRVEVTTAASPREAALRVTQLRKDVGDDTQDFFLRPGWVEGDSTPARLSRNSVSGCRRR